MRLTGKRREEHDGDATASAARRLRPLPGGADLASDTAGATSAPWTRFDADLVDRAFRPALDEFVDEVVAEVVAARGPDAPPLDDVLERNVRVAARTALRQVALAMETNEDSLDVKPFVDLGRKHARVGYPLEDLLDIYRLGAMACWRQAMRLYRDGLFPDELLTPVGEVIFAVSHELSQAAASGYAAESSNASTLAQARRCEFVRNLVAGNARSDLPALERQADRIGWTIPERLAVLAWDAAGQARSGVTSLGPGVIDAPVGALHCALLPAPELQDLGLLERRLGRGLTAVLGPTVPWDDAARSFAQAQQLLALVERELVPARTLMRTDDHVVDLLMVSEPDLIHDLVTRRLGPLLELPDKRREPMLETLDEWLRRPGQLTAIAEDLHVHVQTVRYRVERLRELLGDVIDDPQERLELALATYAVQRRTILADKT